MTQEAKAVATRMQAPLEEMLPVAVTPMSMLDRAVASGAPIEVLEKLMGLQERWEANQARKAFDEAIAEAKAEIPPIIKNRTGHNDKRYADIAALATVVDPIISQQGLSYRFRTVQEGSVISVTCVLSHRAGHSEDHTLSGPADTSGSKNAIQAIGSTLTYLQRYSLIQALGLAASNDDDGAAAGAGEAISDEQIAQLRKAIKDFDADETKIAAFAKVETIEEIPAQLFDKAVAALNEWARKQRKL
jgi:uncharacterized membrane protein